MPRTNETPISCKLETRFGLPVRRAERSGSAAEHVSERRKKAKWRETKRQTEAAAHAVSPTDAARDERAVCEVERAWSRGRRADRQPVERSNPRDGHGVNGGCEVLESGHETKADVLARGTPRIEEIGYASCWSLNAS
jgi:hypothetical protein